MNLMVKMVALLSLMVCAEAGAGQTAAPDDTPMDHLQEQSQSVQRDIQGREAELERVLRREGDVMEALEKTNLAIQRHRRLAAALKVEASVLDRKISSISEAIDDLQRRIHANEAHLSKRLVALYKTSRLGTVHWLEPADSVNALLKRKTALERILSHDEGFRETLMVYYDDLRQLQSQLLSHQQAHRSRMAEYDQQMAAANRERSHRERLLAHIRNQKEIQLTAIDRLRQAARALDQKMQSLSRQSIPKEIHETRPSKPFAEMKGLLIVPVKGKIINQYGAYRHPRLNVQGFRSGIVITADRGEPVKTVYGGTVLFSSWFKGYGNLVIVDHGDHYYTVYAHLEDIFKSVDNRVEAGDVIATVGDSGAMGTADLYFEVRHHDRHLNPLEWLAPN